MIRLVAVKNYVEPENYEGIISNRVKTIKTFHWDEFSHTMGEWAMLLD